MIVAVMLAGGISQGLAVARYRVSVRLPLSFVIDEDQELPSVSRRRK
jgi:hypothetical protein